jgi:protein arginine kinase activator
LSYLDGLSLTLYTVGMERKCDKCDRPASVHLTEIQAGQKIEVHLCMQCAADAGIHIKSLPANVPLNTLLNEMAPARREALQCDVCGMTYSEYRREGRLGCPNDYEAFAVPLAKTLPRMHEGASEHHGKVPHRAGGEQERQTALLRLRAQLKRAIAVEDYERAAVLRNQIQELDQS